METRTLLTADIFVDVNNTTGVEEGTALRPYNTVQEALAAAATAVDGAIVKVAQGTYLENVIMPEANVQFLGGFVGGTLADYTNGLPGDFAAADPVNRATRITGNMDSPVLYLHLPSIEPKSVVIDGFVISGGLHGIYVLDSHPDFYATVTISHNVVENNGPAALRQSNVPSPDGFDFFLARNGGGIYSVNATVTVTHNTIRNNNANRGGGLSVASQSDFTITDNLIENYSGYDDHSGGVNLTPLPTSASGIGTFTRNVIRGNVAARAFDYGWGGGILVAGNNNPASLKPLTLSHNIWIGNSAPSIGGAIFVDDGATVVLDHELISQNSTTSVGGGAIYVDGDQGGAGTGSFLTIKNSTIADNVSGPEVGNGLYVTVLSAVVVSNSIFWGNTDDFAQDEMSTITVTYTDSQEVVPGTGNFQTDPLFADPENGDYHLKSKVGRFDPTANGGSGDWVVDDVHSPAIDAGNPTAAFANEPSPNGGRLNLGVYGNTAEASQSLGTDIVMNSATANGKTMLTVRYEILNSPLAGPFSLRFLQSTNAFADGADTVLSTVTISNAADLTVGTHLVNFTIGSQVLLPGAGKTEVATDYFLLAVADPTNTVTENDNDPLNEDNTVAFVGAYATTTTIYLHGGAMADSVALTYPASSAGMVTLGLTGSVSATYNYAYNSTAAFRLRTHGGNDLVNVVNSANVTARPMWELGGDGDDVLNGAGGADNLNGGTGNDSLQGGIGNDALDGGTGTNTLIASGNVNFTLTNIKLTGVGTDTLANLQVANLTGGSSANTFTVSGWTGAGAGSFAGGGGADTLVASKNVNFTLSNSVLQTSDGMNLTLSGFTKATLTGGSSVNHFTVSGWTGTGTLNGGSGNDLLVAVRDTDMTLTNTAFVSAGFGTLTLASVETASLSGGASANQLLANQFSLGSVTLHGAGGDDVLLGGTKNDSLVGGAGRDWLIGGGGADVLMGDDTVAGSSGEDLLIGGTYTPLRVAGQTLANALDHVMDEWTSGNDYLTRVNNLRNGGGANGNTRLNSATVFNDANALDRLHGSPPAPNNADLDWFFQFNSDVVVDAINGEIITRV